LSSSSTATRCSPTSTETISSRFASGSGARRGASRRRLRLFGARVDRLPQLLQEEKVALDVLGGRALCSGANDHAAALEVESLEDVLEA
jgi:hypothetical protein